MIQSPINWWRAPEQELLRTETARTFRWLLTWRGLLLVAVQVALPFGIEYSFGRLLWNSLVWAGHPSQYFRIQGFLSAISATCLFPVILQRYALSRFAEPQSDHLWILPEKRGVIASSLLARPMLFALVCTILYVSFYIINRLPLTYGPRTPQWAHVYFPIKLAISCIYQVAFSCLLIAFLYFLNIPFRGALRLTLSFIGFVSGMEAADFLIHKFVSFCWPFNYANAISAVLVVRLHLSSVLMMVFTSMLLLLFLLLIRKGIFFGDLIARFSARRRGT